MSHLLWGGADCVELARRFGTPLYVFDEGVIRSRCAEVRRDFLSRWPDTAAFYSGKAFLTRAMARIIEQEGLGLDAVSLGELRTALSSGFPAHRIEMNGNVKTGEELRAALEAGVGRIIVDSLTELEVLSGVAGRMGRRAAILLRVAPGVDPHTHAHIATGQTDSKFGLPVEGDLLPRAVRLAMDSPDLDLRGLHFHVGSQLSDPQDHVESVVRVVGAMARLRDETGFEAAELNMGGGYGAVPHPSRPHLPLRTFTDPMMEALVQGCAAHGLRRPAAAIESGRWIVSESGVTLYRVEVVKKLPGLTYVAVDGGMADNPRVILYQAVYEAALADRPDAPPVEGGPRVSVVGRCCESGDVLIEDARLPEVRRGDILALFNTGAYTFSMASSYNRLGRPAAVLAGEGRAELIVERQTPDGLLCGDLVPERLEGR